MSVSANDAGSLTRSYSGLRVLDFSTTIAGPHCTRMLADLGAEVIKIETSEGETMRTRPPVRNKCSTAFGQLNVGKRSSVLDLKSPEGVEAVHRLVRTADILVENFRPGVMRRLRLDYASLQELNPKLIYCSISGYGQTGRRPNCRPTRPSSMPPPATTWRISPISPGVAGRTIAASIPPTCSLVFMRSAPSARRCISVTAAGRAAHRCLDAGIDAEPDAERSAMVAIRGEAVSAAMFGPIETSDGYVMVAIASEKTFQGLLKVIGHPEWISDPRFEIYSDRRENWASLMSGVEAWSRTVTTERCLAALNGEGVPSSAYRTVAGQALRDPRSPIAERSLKSRTTEGLSRS